MLYVGILAALKALIFTASETSCCKHAENVYMMILQYMYVANTIFQVPLLGH